MMKGVLPEQIRTRRTKIGFENPFMAWLKTPLKTQVFDIASSTSFLTSSIWDGPLLLSEIKKGYAYNDLIKSSKCLGGFRNESLNEHLSQDTL